MKLPTLSGLTVSRQVPLPHFAGSPLLLPSDRTGTCRCNTDPGCGPIENRCAPGFRPRCIPPCFLGGRCECIPYRL